MLGIGEVVTNEDDTLYLQRSINNRRNSHNLLSLQTVRLYFFFPVMLVAERQGYAGLK